MYPHPLEHAQSTESPQDDEHSGGVGIGPDQYIISILYHVFLEN